MNPLVPHNESLWYSRCPKWQRIPLLWHPKVHPSHHSGPYRVSSLASTLQHCSTLSVQTVHDEENDKDHGKSDNSANPVSSLHSVNLFSLWRKRNESTLCKGCWAISVSFCGCWNEWVKPLGHSDSGNHQMVALALGSFAHIFILSIVKHHSLLVKLRCFRGFVLRNETH